MAAVGREGGGEKDGDQQVIDYPQTTRRTTELPGGDRQTFRRSSQRGMWFSGDVKKMPLSGTAAFFLVHTPLQRFQTSKQDHSLKKTQRRVG